MKPFKKLSGLIKDSAASGRVRFVPSKRVEILRDEGARKKPRDGMNFDNLMFMQVQFLPSLVRE